MQMNQINLTSTSISKLGNWAEPESDLQQASFSRIVLLSDLVGAKRFLHFLQFTIVDFNHCPVNWARLCYFHEK